MVIWNYNWLRKEREGGREGGKTEQATIRISGLAPQAKGYQTTMAQISEQFGNPLNPKASPQPLNGHLGNHSLSQGVLELDLTLPPSSVTLVEVTPPK